MVTGKNIGETFLLNSDDSGAMSGGPKCFFKNKRIPCFVGASPKASITSTMLADMLKVMDDLALFDRSTGKKPFLLLDGHQSRFELPFLDYIINKEHEWSVSVGVPYGTHIWQVADAEEINGCFSIAITKAKQALFASKPMSNKNFGPTDIIPLVNAAWPMSFARTEQAKKAIVARGWNPLNYNLLLHPNIIATKAHFIDDQQQSSCTSTSTITGTSTCTSTSSTLNSTSTSINLSTLNTRKGVAGEVMDQFVLEEMKNVGRLEVMKKRKEKSDEMMKKARELALSARVSSTSVAVTTHYQLDENVRNAVYVHHQKKEELERKKIERKEHQKQAFQTLYNKAKAKYTTIKDNSKLTAGELTVLLRYHRRDNDSPPRRGVKNLRCQWEERQHRLLSTLPPIQNSTAHDVIENRTGDTCTGKDISDDDGNIIDDVGDIFVFDEKIDENGVLVMEL